MNSSHKVADRKGRVAVAATVSGPGPPHVGLPQGLLAGATRVVAGGVVTDFDGDGMLDLILSHGESMAQPLSVFRGNQVCMDMGTHRAPPGGVPRA